VSLGEIAIKAALRRDDLRIDASRLLRELLDAPSPPQACRRSRKDPIDRMLVAQAAVVRLTLATANAVVAKYVGSVRLL